MGTDPVVQELMDRSAIRELMARYAHGLDRRDFEMVRSCFMPDAFADYGASKGQGIENILKIVKVVATFQFTMHFMGNQLVEIHGDAADVETYAMDRLRYTAKDGKDYDMFGGLRYLDKMVKREGRWRIQHRVMHTDWRRHEPVTPPPAR